MRVLVIPDIHGSQSWKANIQQHFSSCDVCIFLGDYINSFSENERGIYASNNLKEIIQLKKNNPEKVTLLIGNHDLAHCFFNHANNPHISGYEHKSCQMFNETFLQNKDYFQIAAKVDDWVFSHAGFTKTWYRWAKKMTQVCTPIYKRTPRDPVDFANWMWKKNECGCLDFNPNSLDPYGDDPISSPLWVRPSSLLQDAFYPNQIVGHTEVKSDKPLWIKKDSSNVIIVDSPSHSHCFVLDTKDFDFTAKQLEVESF